MYYKIIFLLFFSFDSLFASYEQLRIGRIDDFYKDKLSEHQLKIIIDEIEHIFESQLNMNIFDYSQNGKPIDIIFETPSKLEEKIKVLEMNLAFLRWKIWYYQTAAEAGTESAVDVLYTFSFK